MEPYVTIQDACDHFDLTYRQLKYWIDCGIAPGAVYRKLRQRDIARIAQAKSIIIDHNCPPRIAADILNGEHWVRENLPQ